MNVHHVSYDVSEGDNEKLFVSLIRIFRKMLLATNIIRPVRSTLRFSPEKILPQFIWWLLNGREMGCCDKAQLKKLDFLIQRVRWHMFELNAEMPRLQVGTSPRRSRRACTRYGRASCRKRPLASFRVRFSICATGQKQNGRFRNKQMKLPCCFYSR